MIQTKDLNTIQVLIRSINTDARLHSTSYGDVEPALLLPSSSHPSLSSSTVVTTPTSSRTCGDMYGHGNDHHGHDHHGHAHGHVHESTPKEKYGIHSFVYRARA